MSDSERLLITGANGAVGTRLIRRLASQRPLRAVVRSERAADVVRALPQPPELVVVDYGDTGGVARAADGCGAVVHLVGILKEGGGARYEDAHERTCQTLVAAAKGSGLRRAVYLSIVGARPDSENECLASKGRAAAILHDSPLDTAVLRLPMVLGGDDPATRVLQGWARAGVVPLVRGGVSLEQPIDVNDVADAITATLDRPAVSGDLDLAGPESLSRRELVLRAAALLGRRPRILPIPLWVMRAFAAAAERWMAQPPLTRAMLGVLEHDDCVDPGPAQRSLGLTLTPLDTTLRRCLGLDPDPEETP